jgi:hypothetical protein
MLVFSLQVGGVVLLQSTCQHTTFTTYEQHKTQSFNFVKLH